MKEAVIKTSSIIEENNKKIIEDYEERVNSLLEELDYCRAEIDESRQLQQKS